jgi:hypothetical protein
MDLRAPVSLALNKRKHQKHRIPNVKGMKKALVRQPNPKRNPKIIEYLIECSLFKARTVMSQMSDMMKAHRESLPNLAISGNQAGNKTGHVAMPIKTECLYSGFSVPGHNCITSREARTVTIRAIQANEYEMTRRIKSCVPQLRCRDAK